jgi:hypothetical protein
MGQAEYRVGVKKEKLRDPQSASELYRQSDRRLYAKLVSNLWIEGAR